jgi:hypothetical protein
MVLLGLVAVGAIGLAVIAAVYAVMFGLLISWVDHDAWMKMILLSFATCGVAAVCLMAIRRLAVRSADPTSQTTPTGA